eukprot:gnl/TRDRNA2_/TRDRNA2_192397_c0_seq1.p1 gnl/TRDRNA2_/TRDRNA2_192397_c0~~gnl/TRDRNA2_/TRDRNA2_192397_c0_seq1.p1  ORF type:complete len:229 (+),score=41.99 gnl/TRDRNA2_/TRDRNA2_192397_c0_seq1:36-689(+)
MGNSANCAGCCSDGKHGPMFETVFPNAPPASYGPEDTPGTNSQGSPAVTDGQVPPLGSGSTESVEEDGDEMGETDSTAASSGADVQAAQQVVKNFVRTIVKGRTLQVLTANGGTSEVLASLDRKLTTLSISKAGKKDAKKRNIALESIAEIIVGDEVGDSDLALPVDEMCVTLMLEDEQALSFRFEDHEGRDTFALCLSMFVDGRRNEVERKAAKNR